MTQGLGEQLRSARETIGRSPAEAATATRIRLRHLEALEAERWAALPAPVYVRGYLRTYANYLELDPIEVVSRYEASVGKGGRLLAFRPLSPLVAAPTVVLTAPASVALGIVLLMAAAGTYIYHQYESLGTAIAAPQPAATIIPSPSLSPVAGAGPIASSPVPSPSPAARSVRLVVTAADTVWIDVIVDGAHQYGDSGKILQAGELVSFEGHKITLKSGKGTATLINVNGKDAGALGGGVTSKDFGG